MRPRSDYLITEDGPETRAYRVKITDDNLDGHDRRTLDDRDRRERIRRTLDRMQASPAEVSRIAAADRTSAPRTALDDFQPCLREGS